MSTLSFRQPNGISSPAKAQFRYRLKGSNGTFTETAQLSAVQFPHTIQNVPSGLYEVGVRVQCAANGPWSAWGVGETDPCPGAIQFSVTKVAGNFVVLFKLAAGQTNLQLEITDPYNGINTVTNGAQNEGTLNVPVNPVIVGEWRFRLRGVCDTAPSPVWASIWSNPIFVNVV